MTDQERLSQLVRSRHACISILTSEEEDAMAVVREAALATGRPLWLWCINGGVRDGLVRGPMVADTEHPAAALYHLLMQIKPAMMVLLDLAGHLKDERVLRLLRDLVRDAAHNESQVVLIDSQDTLPPVIKAVATDFELSLPDEKELEEIVRATLSQISRERPLSVELTREGLEKVILNLRGLSRRQARQIIRDAAYEDGKFNLNDIDLIMARKREALQGSGLLEFVQAPVDLKEIGGLNRLKAWLRQRQPAMTAEAEQFGLVPPRGVLLLGVQGAGKSLAAKAVATAWKYPLMRMDAGALYDKYIGESERRLRDSLKQAERMAPLVLWIDEIEKAFASAASRSTDGGLSQRMFGAILTWMQEHKAPVFLIATANDIEALPPELLRKGRFDEVFFVDLPETEARKMIFEIHIRKRRRDPAEFDLEALAAASQGFSGAEIEQAVIAALHNAFSAGSELSTRRILEAIKSSPPLSVTMAERVQSLREWAKGRCMPAD